MCQDNRQMTDSARERGNFQRLRDYFSHRRVHKILLFVWLIAGAFVNFVLGWQYLIEWVSFMSLYAIVVGHWSSAEAARAAEEAMPKGYNG